MGEEVLRQALETVVGGDDLDTRTARSVMDAMMEGAAPPALVGALLAALRTKRESVDELTGMVEAMRDRATPVHLDVDAVDTCGTGGDGAGTFNISTAAALVAAGAGCPIAKHGNRAASSRCGSADVLEALGVAITLAPDGVRRCVEEAGIGFLFAPAFHPAMRHIAPLRRELGIRTVFNVLGPLANPARVRRQAVGVSDAALARSVAQVLQRLGHTRALVFSGPDGIDELGVVGPAACHDVTPGGIDVYDVDARDLGLEPAPLDALRGGDAADNAAIVRGVLGGSQGAARDAVCINAAAVLMAGGRVSGFREGVAQSQRSIDSGAALHSLEVLIRVSNLAAS